MSGRRRPRARGRGARTLAGHRPRPPLHLHLHPHLDHFPPPHPPGTTSGSTPAPSDFTDSSSNIQTMTSTSNSSGGGEDWDWTTRMCLLPRPRPRIYITEWTPPLRRCAFAGGRPVTTLPQIAAPRRSAGKPSLHVVHFQLGLAAILLPSLRRQSPQHAERQAAHEPASQARAAAQDRPQGLHASCPL